MAINAYGENLDIYGAVATATTTAKDNTALGKDDFMALLLTQMQYQDPTDPMDTEKVLQQTTELATLESSENTKTALEELSATLGSSQQFSTIAAIGKTADLGSNAISYDEGSSTTFEMYFPSDVAQGSVEITDVEGNIIKTLDVGTNDKGVYQFTWDGSANSGSSVDSGVYYASASYTDASGNTLSTRVGAYPIESVRFEDGKANFKLGSSYVSIDDISEVY
jgi:flagellar basal-body rod modification protein FlgD